MKESPEAEPTASAEDVYGYSSLNEHEYNQGWCVYEVCGACVWCSLTPPDLAVYVM